jgi:hypothetical protein
MVLLSMGAAAIVLTHGQFSARVRPPKRRDGGPGRTNPERSGPVIAGDVNVDDPGRINGRGKLIPWRDLKVDPRALV